MDAATPSSTGRKGAESDAKSKRDSFSRKLLVLIGACGFGMELDRILAHSRRGDIILGLIFLAIAVQNSILLIRHKSRHNPQSGG